MCIISLWLDLLTFTLWLWGWLSAAKAKATQLTSAGLSSHVVFQSPHFPGFHPEARTS